MGVGKDLWNQYETLLVKQDLDGVMSLFTSDAVYAGPTWRQEGTEAIRAFFDGYFRAFTDSKLDTSLLIEEGDTVVGEWTGWDTQTGPFVMPDGTEIPATGKRLEVQGVTVCQMTDDKFGTMRDYYDTVPLMTQLGFMPST